MKTIVGNLFVWCAIILCVFSGCGQKKATPDPVRAKEVADLRFGMFICWS